MKINLNDLPKAYNPQDVEENVLKLWSDSGYFNPKKLPERNLKGDSYSIVFPPPNRTGVLHMGHAKTIAIQDLMIRFKMMNGYKTYWVPGTDHAAIATQVKVEQLLIKEGISDPKNDLGRDEFLKRVRSFAQDSRDTIVKQCKRMGAAMDWSNEKYTLDEERNKVVNRVFEMMFEDGLIERGYYLVNWDPKFQTTLSDEEVLHKNKKTKFITFKYDKDFPIVIATTRPETKFGDTAIAVHPDDKRYQEFIGKELKGNFCGKDIMVKVIADKEVDPDFGTGALGVTPAHSMIDGEMAVRHNLKTIPVIDRYGKMTKEAGSDFEGLSIQQAREKIIKILDEQGCLLNVEEIEHSIPVAERGGGDVEVLPMKQWFVRVNKKFKLRQNTLGKWKQGEQVTLKELMRYVVDSNQIKIYPEMLIKTYYHWIDNLRDWCISRQIWFGHQIPVWYKNKDTDQEEIKVSVDSPGDDWERDPDSLDTWFSSGMWTFSVFDWVNGFKGVDKDGNIVKTGELAEYHPTDLLETGKDILPFWVSRMILMSTYVLGEIPFKDAYMHGMVQDDQGRKMSKSLGNVLDPLELLSKYGTDATRLSLLVGNAAGQNQKLSEEKIAELRNFVNKIWNISRFILTFEEDDLNSYQETLADKWILSRLENVKKQVFYLIGIYSFSQAIETLKEFTWNDLADWYIEIAKIEKNKKSVLLLILKDLLKLWHPFMPFITEHIWSFLGMDDLLLVAEWPIKKNAEDVVEFDVLRKLIIDMRRLRSENHVEPKVKIDFLIKANEVDKNLILSNQVVIQSLTRAKTITFVDDLSGSLAVINSGKIQIAFNLSQGVDIDKELQKLEKEINSLEKYITLTKVKLDNSNFISKAPAKVVEDMKDKLEEAILKLKALQDRKEKLIK